MNLLQQLNNKKINSVRFLLFPKPTKQRKDELKKDVLNSKKTTTTKE